MPKKKTTQTEARVTEHAVELVLPMGEAAPGAYAQQHVEVVLDARQACVLRDLREGLQAKGKRLANGRFIQSGADAVRWLLDVIGDSVKG